MLAGTGQVGSGNQLSVPVSVPADICGNAVAVLGDSSAGCAGGASASTVTGGTIAGGAAGSVVSGVLTPVKAAVSSALNAVTPQGRTAGAMAGLAPASGLAPGSGAAGNSNGTQRNSSTTSFAQPGAGDPSVPAASQLAGIGALPGLADLPSVAGLTTMPALNGDTGGGVPMPATALSAATAPPMSSNSFAALAVGALLAGASALKIAGRRVRDRRTGLE
ncbi:MAG: chaplin family protein [Streptosporangiaceae bacterium]